MTTAGKFLLLGSISLFVLLSFGNTGRLPRLLTFEEQKTIQGVVREENGKLILPDISDLLRFNSENEGAEEIVGDVQFLIDFAIVGYAKVYERDSFDPIPL